MSYVDDFLVHFAKHRDFSKASKFEVIINPPAALANVLKGSETLRFQCENAELPGYTINSIDARVYGSIYPVASTPQFSDVNLTFICAGDMWEKQFFDVWMSYILPKGDFLARYCDEYYGSVEIKQYLETAAPNLNRYGNELNVPGEPGRDSILYRDRDSRGEVSQIFSETYNAKLEVAHHVKLLGAFPHSTSPIQLNWQDDSINKLSVTMKYEKWTNIQTSSDNFGPVVDQIERTASTSPPVRKINQPIPVDRPQESAVTNTGKYVYTQRGPF